MKLYFMNMIVMQIDDDFVLEVFGERKDSIFIARIFAQQKNTALGCHRSSYACAFKMLAYNKHARF